MGTADCTEGCPKNRQDFTTRFKLRQLNLRSQREPSVPALLP